MCELDLTQVNSNVYCYYLNDKVVSASKYKKFVKKETSKYKWKSISKELKPLKSVVNSKLKRTVTLSSKNCGISFKLDNAGMVTELDTYL